MASSVEKTAKLEQLEGGLATLEPELDLARAFAAESLALRTRESYRDQWLRFGAWCQARGVAPLPAEPGVVAAYVAARARDGWKVASIALALAALAAVHRAAGHTAPATHPSVQKVWDGVRRTLGGAQRRVAPVLVEDLRAMCAALRREDSLRAVRDRALLLVGFGGAFRRSEIVSIDVEEVAVTAEGLVVRVPRSKTDQEGEGATIGIARGEFPETCPVAALEAWCRESGVTSWALFRAVDRHDRLGGRLQGGDVARIVKRAAAAAGLDPKNYSGHSLRAGLATSAARADKGDREIMRQGRWRSREMVDRYVRDGDLFLRNATKGIGL